ncbi:HAD family hydrolase [Gordonia sp. ABKF26]|uniref:HAD family hydrolase n=1 Tax=Gordonia sp. ABKF26 TaxID=3238687 RepID=UPI0034E5BDAD
MTPIPHPCPLPAHVSAVVFDCDGLLLDTETCWSRAEAALFAEYGFGFGPAEKDLLIGRTLSAACADMAAYFGMPRAAGVELEGKLLTRVEQELSEGVDPMPGALDILNHLGDRVKLGIATNSPRVLLAAALRRAGIADRFDVSIAADEIANPKPAPDIYLEAFDKLNAAPQTGVALEDSSTGVRSAQAAGVFLVTIPSQPGKHLPGDYVCDSLNDERLTAWSRTVVTG